MCFQAICSERICKRSGYLNSQGMSEIHVPSHLCDTLSVDPVALASWQPRLWHV